MTRDRAEVELFADVEATVRDKAISLLESLSTSAADPESSFGDVSIGGQVAQTYIVCTEDKSMLPPQHQRAYAEALEGAAIVEMKCGHSAFLIPVWTTALVDIIDQHALQIRPSA
jgi:hypothetical protein